MVTIKKGTEHTEEFQPKPDQSRLLRLDGVEIARVCGRFSRLQEKSKVSIGLSTLAEMASLRSSQKTASIKDAECEEQWQRHLDLAAQTTKEMLLAKESECQARIEALIEEIQKQLGIPTKINKPFQMTVVIFSEWWQALKAKYCKNKESRSE